MNKSLSLTFQSDRGAPAYGSLCAINIEEKRLIYIYQMYAAFSSLIVFDATQNSSRGGRPSCKSSSIHALLNQP